MVCGAIVLRRARVPPCSMLIWRPLPSAEAANPLPSDVSGLPPHTHCISHCSPLPHSRRHAAGMSAVGVPSVSKHLQLTLALHCTRHAIRAHLVRADASRLPHIDQAFPGALPATLPPPGRPWSTPLLPAQVPEDTGGHRNVATASGRRSSSTSIAASRPLGQRCVPLAGRGM